MTAGSQTLSLSTLGPLPCAQCGRSLAAPTWSEFVSERQVRHLWNCDTCEYEFETLVYFSADEKPETAPPLAA